LVASNSRAFNVRHLVGIKWLRYADLAENFKMPMPDGIQASFFMAGFRFILVLPHLDHLSYLHISAAQSLGQLIAGCALVIRFPQQ